MASKNTEQTVRANEQLDWFKFETRIRKIILELTEPSIKRSRELEAENRTQKQFQDKLNRRLEDREFVIEKLEKKAVA